MSCTMSLIKYNEIVQKSKDPKWIRKKMVEYALEHGIKPTAREFKTTAKTVRKWVRRYKEKGVEGLRSYSRIPKRIHNKMPLYIEQKILKLYDQKKNRGKRITLKRIKEKVGISYSTNSIKRVLLSNRRIEYKKRMIKERKRDMRSYKSRYKAFEKIQVDIKYLDDIEELSREYRLYKLPRYQITARCIRTGAMFISYLKSKSVTNVYIFLNILREHLESNGIDPKEVSIQTDNGSEFVSRGKKRSIVEEYISKVFKKHYRIPPGAKTWQSDVESSHRLIEDEFYAYSEFNSLSDFLSQSHRYVRYFNYRRNNTYKQGSPYDILTKINDKVNPDILNFKPVILDSYVDKYFKMN